MKCRRNQSGVALVITLIMLTVITLIAVAFLALSQRERSSVSSAIVATDADLMGNTALERSKADILGQMAWFSSNETNRSSTNSAQHPYAPNSWITRRMLGPDLRVSVAAGIITNYPQSQADYQALTNLLVDPSVPVFVSRTNIARHYLDLNRNGHFDETGYVLARDGSGNQIPGVTNFVVGDPQWIGMPSRPNEPHSSSNRFVGRYAYIVIPVGRTLDIDFIHNDAKQSGNLGYWRNQGHGTWELNLAAFLADLNTNQWGDYQPNFRGIPFADAFDILNYRYGANLPRTAQDVFGGSAASFANDGIDQYADGDTPAGVDNDDASRPWAGAPTIQHFFTAHDFFNAGLNPSLLVFQNRLKAAGANLDSYNRHTFYRMLAQLGTDSAPEKRSYFITNEPVLYLTDKGPININYNNLKPTPTNELTAARFVDWTPEEFFHVTADRLLRDHGFTSKDGNAFLSVTNLPVYPTNFYTPAVHRILQMTLNIFDATTTNRGTVGPYYPTAIKPLFGKRIEGTNDVVFVSGYQEVPRNYRSIITDAFYWRDLSNAMDRARLGVGPHEFVYGVPVLVGAKKGYPNFNEYVFQSIVQVSRELNVEKELNQNAITNHVYWMGISNYMGIEAWNSYTNPYPRELIMAAGVELSTSLTNDEGYFSTNLTFSTNNSFVLPANSWKGGEFLVPLVPPRQTTPFALDHFLRYSIYDGVRKIFSPFTNVFDRGVFPCPQWVLTTTNRVRFFLFDDGYLVDAVGLASSVTSMNITKALHDLGDPQNPALAGGTVPHNVFWLTNRVNGNQRNTRDLTDGIENQLLTSQSGQPPWNDRGNFNRNRFQTVDQAALGFRQYLHAITNNSLTNVARTNMWAPFVPQQKVYQQFVWQANDPLVHHIVEDLRFATSSPPRYSTVLSPTFAVNSIGRVNPVYQPWNGQPTQDKEDSSRATAATDGTIKDPRIEQSDDWDFPTNKLANVGLLARVHRGTPWQTVYFKGAVTTPQAWATSHRGGTRSNPTNDWRLADIFTVAQHPNASRGRMSVNQTNVAGWSAVFSGVQIPMVNGSGVIETNVIEPALIDPTLDKLVEAINARRESLPGQVFSSLAEFVSVPELTVASPYVTPPTGTSFAPQSAPRDCDYEALVEKTLSLVKPGEARFVVYVFGQSLKPAPQSVIPGGALRGLCVNYEVTGEMAAKAVIRVDSTPQPGPPRLQAVIESFNLLPPD